MSKIDNAQNLEVLKNVRQNGVTPGEFPNSGIKYIQAPDGTKIIAESVNKLFDSDGKLILGQLRVVDRRNKDSNTIIDHVTE